KSVRVWNISASRLIVASEGKVNDLAIAESGAVFATCGEDKQVKLWSVADGKLLFQTGPAPAALANVALRGDGSQVAASHAATISVWPITAKGFGPPQTLAGEGTVQELSYSPDGTRLAVGLAENGLRIVDPGTGRL